MANPVLNSESSAPKDERSSNVSGLSDESCRIYIGNMDTKITELQMIKILQKYGKLKKLDFLYHKAGPNVGQPRGYCFATFEQRSHAVLAVNELNGKFALSRKLIVHWANEQPVKGSKSKISLSAGLGAAADEPKPNICAKAKIRAIEAKLKSMQESADGTPAHSQHQGQIWASSSKHSSVPYQRPKARSGMWR